MNPDIKTEVKLPKFNWDKILIRSALLMAIVTIVSFVSRWRSLVLVAEVVDVVVVLFLLGLGTFALIAKSCEKSDQ